MKKTVVVLLLLMICSYSFAGSTPNGKPFVYIKSQVEAINSKIDALVGKFDSLEQELHNTNAALMIMSGEIDSLSQDVSYLEGKANVDQETLDAVHYELQLAKDTYLTLQNRIESLEEEMAIKQHVVSGTCPNGYAIQAVNQDGSVSCQSVVTQSGSGLSFTRSSLLFKVEPHYQRSGIAYCPTGYEVMGGGFAVNNNVKVSQSASYTKFSTGQKGWILIAQNLDGGDRHYAVIAQCLKIQ